MLFLLGPAYPFGRGPYTALPIYLVFGPTYYFGPGIGCVLLYLYSLRAFGVLPRLVPFWRRAVPYTAPSRAKALVPLITIRAVVPLVPYPRFPAPVLIAPYFGAGRGLLAVF